MVADGGRQIVRIKRRKSRENSGALAGAENHFCTNPPADPASKIRAASIIQGNREDAGESASEESSNPFRAISAPQENGISFDDIACSELACELVGGTRNALVGPALAPVSTWKDVGRL
jgi:hypothetical protein